MKQKEDVNVLGMEIRMYQLGFIGTGNMGSAIARSACAGISADEVLLANRTKATAERLAEELGCAAGENCDVAKMSRYIFLGVKPQAMAELLSEIAPVLRERKDRFVLVSMAAGVKLGTIEHMLQTEYPVIRMMPNIAAAVGESMLLFTANAKVTKEERQEFCHYMEGMGQIDEIPEGWMDAGCALSGSGTAFAFLFLEALSDGAVACGLPRERAMKYAAQTLLGSAKLMLEDGRHPAELKDAVCSPGGTTIAGISVLESAGFRGAAIEAVKAAYGRACELS